MRRVFASLSVFAHLCLAMHPAGAQAPEQPASLTPFMEVPEAASTSAAHDDADYTGAYSPRIPLEAPPARGGMAPDVSLVYSPNHRNGPLGPGWRFAFESVIERVGPRGGVATLTPTDKFLLDGQELVGPSSEGSYTLLRDPFTKVTPVLASGGGVAGWRVEKDGITRTFGATSPSQCGSAAAIRRRSSASNCADAVAWHLTELRDSFSNRVSFSYSQTNGTQQSGVPLVTSIVYGDSDQESATTVQMLWEDRPDDLVSFRDGARRIESRRLSALEIKVSLGGATQLTHRYELAYLQQNCDNRSLLHEVRRRAVDSSGATQSELRRLARFTYKDGANGGCAPTFAPLEPIPLSNASGEGLHYDPNTVTKESILAQLEPALIDDLNEWAGSGIPTPDDPNGEGILGVTDSLRPRFRAVNTAGDARPELHICFELCRFWVVEPSGCDGLNPCKHTSYRRCVSKCAEYSAADSTKSSSSYTRTPREPVFGAQYADVNADGALDTLIPDTENTVSGGAGFTIEFGAPSLSGAPTPKDVQVEFLSLDEITAIHHHNGDQLPELAVNSIAFRNRGAPPWFDVDETIEFSDSEVTFPGAGCQGENSAVPPKCGDVDPWFRYGADSQDFVSCCQDQLVARTDWVGRHTLYADVNGDSIEDRLRGVPWLSAGGEYSLDCGLFSRTRLGTGLGQFQTYSGTGSAAASGPGYLSFPLSLRSTQFSTCQFEDPTPDSGTGWTEDFVSIPVFAETRPSVLTVADFDGNGSAELIAICKDNGESSPHWIPYTDGTLGFLFGGLVCPPGAVPMGWSLYEAISGDTGAGELTRQVVDLDGDGVLDVVEFSGVPFLHDEAKPAALTLHEDFCAGSLPPASCSAGELPNTSHVRWRRGLRGATPQNRLVSIEWESGGSTAISWRAHLDANGSPPSVVVDSVTDATGTRRYAFSHPTYVDGAFLGFGRMEVASPRGSRQIRLLGATKATQGLELLRATVRADGKLHSLRVNAYGATHSKEHLEQWGTLPGSPNCHGLDLVPPMFNPQSHACEFEFAQGLPTGVTIDGLVQQCYDLDEECEEGAGCTCGVGGCVRSHAKPARIRAIFAAFGHRPFDEPPTALDDLANWGKQGGDTPILLTQLRSIHALANNDPSGSCPAASLGPSGPGLALTPTLTPEAASSAIHPAGVQLLEGTLGASVGSVPVPTAGDSIQASGGLDEPRWRASIDTYSAGTGKRLFSRAFGDLRGSSDTVYTQFTYHAPDAANYPWWRLASSEKRDVANTVLERLEYPSYVGPGWTKMRQVGVGFSQAPVRERTRTFNSLGDVTLDSGWGGLEPLATAWNRCGLLSVQADAVGGWEARTYDHACRLVSVTDSRGLKEWYAYDGYSRTTLFGRQPWPSPTQETRYRFFDGPSYVGAAAQRLELKLESDGTYTMVRHHIDEWGRPIAAITCGADGGANSTGECIASEPTWVRHWGYTADGGILVFETARFELGEPDLLFRSWAFDDLGRAVAERRFDGAVTLHAQWPSGAASMDPLGRVRSTYVEPGRVEWRIDAEYLGEVHRDALGRQVLAIDAEGRETEVEYDTFGRPFRTVFAETQAWPSGAATPTLTASAITTWRDAADRVVMEEDEVGTKTFRAFDATGRWVSVVGHDGQLLAQRTFQEGSLPWPTRLVITQDDLGGVQVEALNADGAVRMRQSASQERAFTFFDARGRVADERLPWGERRTHTYNRVGDRVATSSDASGSVAQQTRHYNGRGALVKAVDADGASENLVRDALDRVVQRTVGEGQGGRETEYRTYDAAGRLTSLRTHGALQRFGYDLRDRLVYEERGAGAPNEPPLEAAWRIYTPAGNLQKEVNAAGESVVHQYDARNRRVRSDTFHPNNGPLAPVSTREWGYDAAGRMTRTVDERGIEERRSYDPEGRLVSVTAPGAGTRLYSHVRKAPHPLTGQTTALRLEKLTYPTGEITSIYSDSQRRERFAVGADGALVETTYGSGLLRSRLRYGANKQLYAVKPTRYWPKSSRVQAEFSWLEPPLEKTCMANPSKCPAGAVEAWHTPAGRLHSLRDAASNVTQFDWQTPGNGLLESIAHHGLYTRRFEYHPEFARVTRESQGPTDDPIHADLTHEREYRLVETQYTRPSTGEIEQVINSYDDAGRVASQVRASAGKVESMLHWTYDTSGRVEERISTVFGVADVLRYEYLANGLISRIEYPDGGGVDYDYAPNANRLLSVWADGAAAPLAEFSQFDASGRPLRAELNGGEVQVDREFSAGREVKRTLLGLTPGPLQETRTYDTQGRLAKVDTTSDGSLVERLEYDYDVRDQITADRRIGGGTTRQQTYQYDAAGRRIASSTSIGGAVAASTAYLYGGGNRLTGLSGTGGSQTLLWDSYGRQRQCQRGNRYAYSLSGHLRQIREASGLVTDHVLAPDGQRLGRQRAGTKDRFVSGQAPGEVHWHAQGGATSATVIRSPAGTPLAVRNHAGTVTPVVMGASGSPLWVGGSSTGASLRHYGAFGNATSEWSHDELELSFHQTWWSGLDDLYVAGVRAYDGDTGRFLTTDPLQLGSTPAVTHATDFFRYAVNSPVQTWDPTGYMPLPNTTPWGTPGSHQFQDAVGNTYDPLSMSPDQYAIFKGVPASLGPALGAGAAAAVTQFSPEPTCNPYHGCGPYPGLSGGPQYAHANEPQESESGEVYDGYEEIVIYGESPDSAGESDSSEEIEENDSRNSYKVSSDFAREMEMRSGARTRLAREFAERNKPFVFDKAFHVISGVECNNAGKSGVCLTNTADSVHEAVKNEENRVLTVEVMRQGVLGWVEQGNGEYVPTWSSSGDLRLTGIASELPMGRNEDEGTLAAKGGDARVQWHRFAGANPKPNGDIPIEAGVGLQAELALDAVEGTLGNKLQPYTVQVGPFKLDAWLQVGSGFGFGGKGWAFAGYRPSGEMSVGGGVGAGAGLFSAEGGFNLSW